VTGAVWGEYVGSENGLGIFMQRAQHRFDVPAVFAAVIVIAALSVGLFLLTSIVERLTIPWYFASRRQARGVNL
jgi:ABC-type nitrate/sulfonate/bicarbonate transport system permease component